MTDQIQTEGMGDEDNKKLLQHMTAGVFIYYMKL